MRRALGALMLAVMLSCASPGPGKAGDVCERVDVIVDSNHWLDVVVRDEDAVRLGVAEGLKVTRFGYCLGGQTSATFILDPVGGGLGHVVEGGVKPVAGATVLMSLGSNLRISFATVVNP